MDSERTDARPSLIASAGYGLGDLGFLIVWQTSALFLLFFYTDRLGLPPWLAGLIILVALVWDAVSDPLIAAWTERRAARTGRYAPIILWSALPVGIGFALSFTAPFGGIAAAAAWALLTQLVFRTAYTFASMPYNTLPLRLTRDTNARSTLSAFRVAGAAMGGLITAIAAPLLIDAAGFQIAAIAAGGVTACLLAVTALTCRDRSASRPSPPHRNLLDDIGRLWTGIGRNGPVLRLLTVMVAATLGYGLFTASAVYFMQGVAGRPDLLPALLGVSALMTIVLAPVWAILGNLTSKRIAMIAGAGLAAIGYALLASAAGGPIVVLILASAIAGAGGSAIPVMLWSMLPDAVEHGEAETGERIEARTFGLTTFVQKCAAGLSAVTAGLLLSVGGYQAGAVQSETALLTLSALTGWLPAGFMLLVVAAIWSYPIDRARHEAILESLRHSD